MNADFDKIPASYKRRWRNYLQQPVAQIRLGFFSILIAMLFSLVSLGILYSCLSELFDVILELTDQPREVEELAMPYFLKTLGWVSVAALGFCVLQIVTVVILTHQLVGPIVAFENHVKRLIVGDLTSLVRLRKYDSFGKLAALLNELTLSLRRNLSPEGHLPRKSKEEP